MVFPMMAAMALGGALGGLGGKNKAKQANQPVTTTTRSQLTPNMQLGGYDRINEALNRVRDITPYRPGMNNPYLGATFSHILGRAGVQAPQGGWQMPTPAQGLPPMPGQQGGGFPQLTPEMLQQLQSLFGGGGMQNNPYLGGGMRNMRAPMGY